MEMDMDMDMDTNTATSNNPTKRCSSPSPAPSQTPSSQPKDSGHQLVDFTRVKEWITLHEMYQSTTGKPAPLTGPQRAALTQLLKTLTIPPSPAKPTEPDVGDRDWVSLLHRFRDATKSITVTFLDSESPPGTKRWVCTCTITGLPPSSVSPPSGDEEPRSSVEMVFPEKQQQQQPSFARKKDAKQYAAKCCVEWLQEHDYMPWDVENVVFKKQKSQPPQPPKQQPKQTQQPRQDDARVGIMEGDDDGGVNIDDDSVPATRKVVEMCTRLRFCCPRYEFTPSKVGTELGAGEEVYDGYADFGVDKVRIPDSVGRVSGIPGKSLARQRIAEAVLEYLTIVDKERKAAIEAVLGDNNPQN
ncbi:hypothetical protein QBC46DRAFT_373945 [Diplogelasinospora grovesii]|uniref:Uncharacterized protein n=1 Tax=Diplogelasinospora grovesii TaxID=303347 RepID=A0AAN6NGZ5_9PEZI|nr:hypothetical protein QBC46DRAFT_373945 [Diplogelasinospora grovesii]